MGIIKRGESGKSSIRNYYNQLKTDNWKGNTRDIRAPFLGPTGRRKHLHGAALLGGLYLLGQFRSTEPRIFTAGKYAVAPIIGTTIAGKIANTAIDALRAGQQLGVLPIELTSNYPDIPVTLDPLKVAKAIFKISPLNNEIRKKYGLQYGSDKSYETDLGSATNPDIVPVSFRTSAMTIPVRGVITGLSDTVTPTWNESLYVGRPQAVVTYGGFTREVSFDLTLAALSPQQLRPMWHKINDIMQLVLPDSDYDKTRFTGRLCQVTVGNYIEDQLCAVGGITITPSEDAYWEIEDPDIDHPSLTLNPSIGNKLQTAVKRKLDIARTMKGSKKKPATIPLSRSERETIKDDGSSVPFIMPRVVTLNISLKMLHNSIPGTTDGSQLFNVSEGTSVASSRFLPIKV